MKCTAPKYLLNLICVKPIHTNFNTDDGVYCQKRLVHGNNNAFEIFQRALEQNIGKIKGVKLIGDDIILYAQNEG